MKNISLKVLVVLGMTVLVSCLQSNTPIQNNPEKVVTQSTPQEQEPHRYGGWYCPDNLRGFPAVDFQNWQSVPVVNGRMATKEEAQNGTSLIFVDMEKYPNAKPLDMQMPRIARYYSRHTQKEELVIVIQALNISNDSIVGFRYLNGGNGSARLNEVRFLSDQEIEKITPARFVSFDIEIKTESTRIWKVLTEPEYYTFLQPIFDPNNTLKVDKGTTVNYKYLNAGTTTAEYGDLLFGNYYIQIDSEFDEAQYVEKFMLTVDKESKNTILHVVCGPYTSDYESQEDILNNWAEKVKELSETP